MDKTSFEKLVMGGSPAAHLFIFATVFLLSYTEINYLNTPNQSTMYPELLQAKLESVVLQYVNQHSEKPRLLKINQEDFRSILPHSDQCIQFGLRIKGVTTVGTSDVKRGSYFLVP